MLFMGNHRGNINETTHGISDGNGLDMSLKTIEYKIGISPEIDTFLCFNSGKADKFV